MARTRAFRPPFLTAAAKRRGEARRQPHVDASSDFVATRDIKVSGQAIAAGEPFDKSLVDERRLRQMYEARLIAAKPRTRTPRNVPRRSLPRRQLKRAA